MFPRCTYFPQISRELCIAPRDDKTFYATQRAFPRTKKSKNHERKTLNHQHIYKVHRPHHTTVQITHTHTRTIRRAARCAHTQKCDRFITFLPVLSLNYVCGTKNRRERESELYGIIHEKEMYILFTSARALPEDDQTKDDADEDDRSALMGMKTAF